MWGTVLSVGGSILGGMMSGDAAESGANTAAAAADRAGERTMQMYHETADRLQPWVSTGGDALKRLSTLMGLSGANRAGPQTTREQILGEFARNQTYTTPDGGWETSGSESAMNAEVERRLQQQEMPQEAGYGDLLKKFSMADFEADPGYQFRKDEGEKALQRGATARGLTMSTPGLKDLTRFNQDLASSEYGAAYTRDAANKQRTFDYLSYLSGSGQNAAAQVGVAGTNAAAASASLAAQAGQITGQGQINSAALTSNGISSGIGNYMYQKRYDDMMSRMPVFSQSTPGNISSGTFGLGAGE